MKKATVVPIDTNVARVITRIQTKVFLHLG
jgi:hypothetical protein